MHLHRLLALAFSFALLPLATTQPLAVVEDPEDTVAEPVEDEAKAEEEEEEELTEEEEEILEKIEDYEDALEELERLDGPFPLYLDGDDVLLELSQDKLGQLFFVQAALHTGFSPMMAQSGDPLGPTTIDVFAFEKQEDNVWLVRPNTRYRWDEDNDLAVASERTFPRAILGSFDIEEEHPEKGLYLLEVTDLFSGELFELQDVIDMVAGGYGLDREKTGVDRVKQYDKNTVLRMKMHFESRGGAPDAALAEILGMLGLGGANHLEDPRSIPLKVTYNLWYREPGNYMPRLADGRIGYFTTDHFSVDNYYRADSTEKYINRFHLEKADPQADLSEPVEPIVWYIDPSVPEEFRPAVREGILSWNEAYEEIGYQNAIVVKEVDPNNEDYDHADGMQNVVRWTMSESTAYAVALFRTDPFTGEILNASVTVDASYPALLKLQFNEEIEPTLDTARQAALDSLARSSMRTEHVHGPDCSHGEGWHAHKDELREKGWRLDACNHAEEFGREASMMTALLSALNAEVDEDKFIHDFVRETIAHEIGHCLGLRHNFAGSTYLEVDELGNPAITSEKGLSASVMDYNPPNVKAALEGSPVMFNDGPGVYDKWAIRYGYMDVIAASPEGERYALDPVAKQSGKPGHLFLTDEDADGINPLAVRWDSGGDSLNYLQSVLRSFDLIRDYAATDFTEQGEAYARRNQLILGTIVTGFRRAEMAARYIGGVEYRVHHKGDVGEQPTLKPVSARDQRLAMRLIVEEFLTKEKVDVPDSVLLSMNVEAESGLGATWNAPLRQLIGTQQTALLAQLMGADTADKILENEFKMVGIGEAYTLAEHYAMLLQAVYKEIGEDRSITPLRRDLQRFMLDAMIDVATLPNGFVSDDLRVVASQSLKRLQKRFRDQMVSGAELDAMTRLHLSDMDDRVTRFLNREVVADR